MTKRLYVAIASLIKGNNIDTVYGTYFVESKDEAIGKHTVNCQTNYKQSYIGFMGAVTIEDNYVIAAYNEINKGD